MQVKENSYVTLAAGTQIELKGKALGDIRFVRSKLSTKERKDGEAPRTYHMFTVGGRGFTIDSSDQEAAELLMDKAKRRTVASITLTATEHDVPEYDEDGNETGETVKRKSFRFDSILTVEDAIGYLKAEGVVAQEEAKFAPKQPSNAISAADLSKTIAESIAASVKAAFASITPVAPTVAPKEVVESEQ